MPFVAVHHEQGTAAWLNWRLDGIGASDAPALMGENPWKRPERLFAEKCAAKRSHFSGRFGGGGGQATGSAAGRGTALEPRARRLYCEARGVAAEPLCLESRARPWQRASLDGIDRATGHAVEIKCGDAAYAHVARTGAVPPYYVGQLQHILAVTGYAAVDFFVWVPGRAPLLLTVPRDEAYIDRLLEREAEFWTRVTWARGSLL
jgi:putative phage-type endonuclease